MCGIAGVVNWNGAIEQECNIVQAMNNVLVHRGPDASGIKALDLITLGHRRLSILDVHRHANQPMLDSSKRYWIIFNGEIYNFLELKKELEALGVTFKTSSDTEVILEAWQQWGTKAIEKLVGMFAFSIWDSREKTLFLVRDRLGEKPLLYMPNKENDLSQGIVFASELKALRQHPNISNTISHKALSQYLSLNYILTESCILENVQKVPPAHFVVFKKNQTKQTTRKYKNNHPCCI